MRRFPALVLFLGAVFTVIGINQSSAVNETRITSVGYVIRVQVSLSTNAGTSVAYSLATTAVAST